MKGTRIIDLTRVLAGPWATMHLADQGADVVKIESPEGDETRQFGPVVDGHSTYFPAANRNKRSVALDLKSAAGVQILHRLLQTADVLIHNFRPGVAPRLGCGWEQLRDRYPRLVYVSICGFGDDPSIPDSRRPAYDLVLQCMGGTVSIGGFPGSPPTRAGVSIADHGAGLLAVNAVLTGLLQRERTGRGQKIVVNMLHAQAASLSYHVTRYTRTGEMETRRGNAHAGLVPYDIYRCADGDLAVACGNDRIWRRLCGALGIPSHARWATNAQRIASREAVDAAIGAALAPLSLAQADALLTAVSVPCGPVNDIAAAIAHPATTLVDVPHPTGPMAAVGPILVTETTRLRHRPAPALGAHRDEVLAEAGMSDADIAEAERLGAFGATRPSPS